MGRGAAVVALALLAACRPSSVADAEAKGDVAWLEDNGTPDAVAALGRLADKNPKAVAALETRSAFDGQAFKAAWSAVVRGAPWGTTLLRSSLADPKRADMAAAGMERREPHLVAFLVDLEGALVRLSATLQNVNVSAALASIGPAATDAVARRLVDASTRGGMCRGIASRDADASARRALLEAAETSRDDPSCVDAVVRIAVDDETALVWMAERGEPGILGAAGKSDVLSCPRLHVAWARAIAARPPEVYSALTVPLGYALKRCAAEMDGVVADAIAHRPATRAAVVQAIDPYEGYGGALRATCAALPSVAVGRDGAIVRERASDALVHNACKPPG
jgi:hypothetical protein